MLCPHHVGISVILGLALPSACAGGQSTLDRLNHRVAELSHRVEEQRRTIEDLTVQLAAATKPSAPRSGAGAASPLSTGSASVGAPSQKSPLPAPSRTRPAASPLPRAAADPPVDRAAAKRLRQLPVVKVSDTDAEVQAPAGGKGGRREVLRLTGAPPIPSTGAASGASGRAPFLTDAGDRLGVVPLPDVPAIPARTDGAGEEFQAARALQAGRKYREAARLFSRLAKTHPGHALADDATYGMAECAWAEGQPKRAAWILRGLLRKHPSGNKAPAALLLLAECEARLGRREEASKVLAQVRQLYPKSPEAALAARRMRGQR